MNDYSGVTSVLASELLTALTATYSGLVVDRRLFKPDRLPSSFTNYGIIVSPNARPWDERRTAIREVQYIFRVDLFLLVRNFDESKSLFGDTGEPGLFDLIADVKTYLRTSDLGGLLDKTGDEPGGDPKYGGGGGVEFQQLATTGLDAGNDALIQRALVPFVGRTQPFCHPKVI